MVTAKQTLHAILFNLTGDPVHDAEIINCLSLASSMTPDEIIKELVACDFKVERLKD